MDRCCDVQPRGSRSHWWPLPLSLCTLICPLPPLGLSIQDPRPECSRTSPWGPALHTSLDPGLGFLPTSQPGTPTHLLTTPSSLPLLRLQLRPGSCWRPAPPAPWLLHPLAQAPSKPGMVRWVTPGRGQLEHSWALTPSHAPGSGAPASLHLAVPRRHPCSGSR